MPATFMSGRDFNQDVGRAKRAADNGPVIVTDRGKPAYVLQRYEDWRKQSGAPVSMSLLDAVTDSSPEADFEFEPPRIDEFGIRPADFS